MKKFSLVTGIIILLFSACSALKSTVTPATPTPLPAPTPTPDPCSKENILVEAEKLQMMVNEFREVADLANSTDVNFLFIPVLRLQELRYQAINTKVPACLDAFKASATNYTASVINYMVVFMNVQDPESEDLNNAISNSQNQWQVLLNEFNKILAISGVQTQAVPDTGTISPTATVMPVFATNEGSSTVNVRAKPDLNGDVIASMEQGIQAEVIGRTEASDWLQVKLNDVTGWIFTEMVTTSVPVDQLPIVEVIP